MAIDQAAAAPPVSCVDSSMAIWLPTATHGTASYSLMPPRTTLLVNAAKRLSSAQLMHSPIGLTMATVCRADAASSAAATRAGTPTPMSGNGATTAPCIGRIGENGWTIHVQRYNGRNVGYYCSDESQWIIFCAGFDPDLLAAAQANNAQSDGAAPLDINSWSGGIIRNNITSLSMYDVLFRNFDDALLQFSVNDTEEVHAAKQRALQLKQQLLQFQDTASEMYANMMEQYAAALAEVYALLFSLGADDRASIGVQITYKSGADPLAGDSFALTNYFSVYAEPKVAYDEAGRAICFRMKNNIRYSDTERGEQITVSYTLLLVSEELGRSACTASPTRMSPGPKIRKQ